MKIETFSDVVSWQKSKELTVEMYKIFDSHKDFGFRDQIQRASVSIMNNIAEGFERRTHNELRAFLSIAKGSCGEVRSMLLLALDLKYISQEDFERNYNLTIEISKLLFGFIKTL